MKLSTVIIADDHALFVELMKVLLEHQCSVIATASNGQEVIEKITLHHPEICLCDIAMPQLTGLEALRQCRQANFSTRFIMISGSPDTGLAMKAFQAGAHGYLAKTQSIADALAAIKQVASGNKYTCPSVAEGVLKEMMFPSLERKRNSDGMPSLTIREAQVLQLLAEGYAIKEIAVRLNVSTRTVEFHKNNICDKTGFRTVPELTRFALRNGFTYDSEIDCGNQLPRIGDKERFAARAFKLH